MKGAPFLCVLAFVSIMLTTSFSVWSYEENFDSGEAVDWVDASAGKSWEVEKKEYHQPDTGNVNVFTCYAVDDKKWKDYTFEVQIKPISVSNYAGVLFRVKDPGAGGTSWSTGDFLYWLIGIGGSYSKLWDAPAGAAVHDTDGDTLIYIRGVERR